MTQEGFPFMWVWFVCLYTGNCSVKFILELCCENSCYVHVGPADALWVGSLHIAKEDSSRCAYDCNVLQKG